MVQWWFPLWFCCVGLLELSAAGGVCPHGFDKAGSFPASWNIPEWPSDLSPDEAARLRLVTFSGFESNTFLNEEYIEGPNLAFAIQGRESYWSASGKLFLYYCKRFKKWRIAEIEGFRQIKGGQCYGLASQKASNVEILDAQQPRGWMEVADGKWTVRMTAGVDDLSTVKEKMEAVAAKAAAEKAAARNQSEDEELDDEDDGVSPAWVTDKNGPMCPLRPAYETVKETAKEVVKSTYRWVKSMLPLLLGAPDDPEATGEVCSSSEQCNSTEAVKST